MSTSSEHNGTRRWVGLIGSWALFVLGAGLLVYAVAAEAINLKDASNYYQYGRIDALIADWKNERIAEIEQEMNESATRVGQLEQEVETKAKEIAATTPTPSRSSRRRTLGPM